MQNAPNTPRRGRRPLTARNNATNTTSASSIVPISPAARDVVTSNQTTNHFLGTNQRSWMIPGAAIQRPIQHAPHKNTSDTFTDASGQAGKATQNASQTPNAPPTPIMASADKALPSYRFLSYIPTTPPEEPHPVSTEREDGQDIVKEGQELVMGPEQNQEEPNNAASTPQPPSPNQPEAGVIDLTMSQNDDAGAVGDSTSDTEALHGLSALMVGHDARSSPQPAEQDLAEAQVTGSGPEKVRTDQNAETARNAVQGQAPNAASTPAKYMPPSVLVRQQQSVSVSASPRVPQASENTATGPGIHRPPSVTRPPSAQLLTPVTSPRNQLLGRKRPLSFDTTAQDFQHRMRVQQPQQSPHTQRLPAQTAVAQPAVARPNPSSNPGPSSTIINRGAPYLATFRSALSEMQTRMVFSERAQPRISWIEDACKNNDLKFLLLHQLFCLWTMRRTVLEHEFKFGTDCDAGFEILALLLFRNEDLPSEFLAYLAGFPNSPFSLKASEELRTWTEELRSFLPRLGAGWEPFRQLCLTRRVPPTARELCEVLACPPSIVLQKAIFTSIEKQIHPYSDLDWHTLVYNLFTSFQRAYDQTDASRRLPLEYDTRVFVNAYNTRLNLSSQGLREASFAPILQSPTNFHSDLVSLQNYPQTGGAQGSRSTGYLGQRAAQLAITQASHGTNLSLQAQSSLPTPSRAAPPQSTSLSHNQCPPSTRPQSMISASQPPPMFSPNQSYQFPVPANSPLSGPWPPVARNNAPQDQQHYSRIVVNDARALVNDLGPIQNNFIRSQTMVAANQAQMQPSYRFPSNAREPATLTSALPIKLVNAPNTRLLPQLYALPPFLTNPDPVQDALHQTHLRQPITKMKDENTTRLYQFVSSFALEPYVFAPKNVYFEVPFSASDHVLKSRAQTIHGPEGSFQLPTRALGNGSIVFNLRCVKLSDNELTNVQNADLPTWTAMQTSYPEHIFMSLNGHHLEFRRKRNYKCDMPVDVTDVVQPGKNTVKVSFHPSKDELYKTFALAVEVITFQDHGLVSAMPSKVSAEDALRAIIATMKPATSDKDDDDITIVNDSVSIEVTDPFLSTLWTTPVRGLQCRHKECFDLQTFLQTRPSDMKDALTSVNAWTCPLCSKDARPGSLVVDGFMQVVRETLLRQGRDDARAIIVKEDGNWTIKEEKLEGTGPLKGRQGSTATPDTDGQGKVPAPASADRDTDVNLDHISLSSPRAGTGTPASESRVVEIIDLDDD